MGDIIGSTLVLIGCIYYMSMNLSYPDQAQMFPRAVIVVTGILAIAWLASSVKNHLSLKAADTSEQQSTAPAEMKKRSC